MRPLQGRLAQIPATALVSPRLSTLPGGLTGGCREAAARCEPRLTYFPVKMPGQPVVIAGSSSLANIVYPSVTYTHGTIPQRH